MTEHIETEQRETTCDEADSYQPVRPSNTVARSLMRTTVRPGMTLVEIMIVLTIMAGIMAFAAYSVVGYLQSSKVKDAQAEVNQIRGFIDTYRVMHNGLPDDLQDLEQEEGLMGAVTEHVPDDPWDNPYEYSKNNDGSFILFSKGSDGQSNTDDDIYPEGMNPRDN